MGAFQIQSFDTSGLSDIAVLKVLFAMEITSSW